MALNRLTLRIAPADAGKRLDQALADWLPTALGQPVSKSRARALIVAGAVYLNQRRVRIASKVLLAGARIDVYVDRAKLTQSDSARGTAKDRAFEMTDRHVLFEDDWIIVVDKPPGLPTQPTLDEARENLFASVKRFLAKKAGIADPYLGLHHRLDRDTSGVILFTKSKEANAGVSEMFAKHLAQKTYEALTELPRTLPSKAWQVENYLGKAPGGGKRTRMTAVRSGGDYALTEFRLLEVYPAGLRIEAKPKTGRMHQIRVHLAEGGMPILGDVQYGARAGGASRVMLHAACLTFPHPILQTEVSVQSPLPEDFRKCLEILRKMPR